jgi:hypothetical protein
VNLKTGSRKIAVEMRFAPPLAGAQMPRVDARRIAVSQKAGTR